MLTIAFTSLFQAQWLMIPSIPFFFLNLALNTLKISPSKGLVSLLPNFTYSSWLSISKSNFFSCFSNHMMARYVFLHSIGHGGWRCPSLHTKGEESMIYHVSRNRFSASTKILFKLEIIFCFSLSSFWIQWLGLRLVHRWVAWHQNNGT